MIILFSIIGIETLLLLFIVIKTPALTFLAASFFKKSIMIIVGRDKISSFKTFKREFGSAHIKKEGLYNLTENSHMLDDKSKVPMYLSYRDFAGTLDITYPCLLQELREKGLKISTIEDYKDLLKRSNVELKQKLPLETKQFKTYKINDLENMFPFNIDPTFVEAQVQGKLAKFNRLMKAAPMALMGIVILLVVAAITVFILQRAFKGCISQGDCANICNMAQAGATAAKTVVSTTPIA